MYKNQQVLKYLKINIRLKTHLVALFQKNNSTTNNSWEFYFRQKRKRFNYKNSKDKNKLANWSDGHG